MKKVLVDTSVWIDALNGKNLPHVKQLNKLIEQDTPIVICPVIIQEILQGIREEKNFIEMKDTLSGFEVLHIDPIEAAYGAANLYRTIRKKGITIRKSNDCLIAWFAIYHKTELFHKDLDFTQIERYSLLRCYSFKN